VTAFSLPWTKSAPEGKEVYWAVQDGVWDPAAALDNHMAVNNPADSSALFSWRHPSGKMRPLRRTAFVDRLDMVARQLGDEK
jgi:hypothetical protein